MTEPVRAPERPTRPTPMRRLARAVTEMLAPAVLIAVLLVLLGWHSSGYQPRGLLWGLCAGTFESLIPFAYIVRGVRSGRFTDHHVGVREQRRAPFLFGLGSVLVGLVLLLLLGAARQLLAAVVAGGVGLVVAVVVSHWWKMSIHAAVAGGSCVIFAFVFGPLGLLGMVFVALVAWSRVKLGDHTVPQVVVGAVVGALVAGVVYAPLA